MEGGDVVLGNQCLTTISNMSVDRYRTMSHIASSTSSADSARMMLSILDISTFPQVAIERSCRELTSVM